MEQTKNTTVCGVTNTLKIIGSKWTILILHQLCTEKKRFGQLLKDLPGISPRTQSARLKELESNGIVSKKVFSEIPLHVEYSLTPKGSSLRTIIDQMEEWGKNSV